MTTAELQLLMDAGGPLPPGDITLTQPLFVKGEIAGNKTTLHTNNCDALIALPDALRFFDPAPYFPLAGFGYAYRTLGHSCIRFLNTPGDRIQNRDQLTISMRLKRYDSGGSIVGLAGNRSTGEKTDNFPASPFVLYTREDIPGALDLKMKLASGVYNTTRWIIGSPGGPEQLLVVEANLAAGTVTCRVDGATLPINAGTLPPVGSKLADNQTSALFLGAVSNQATSKGEWGCCDCTMRDVLISYGGPDFLPDLTRPTTGLPLIAYNGGFGLLSPTNVDDWAKGTLIRDVAFSGQDWGSAITVQSAIRTRVENIKVEHFATGAQVLGGPLPNYPVDVVNLYGDHQRDTLLRLQRCSLGVIRNLYADYPRRSVLRADNCGTVTARDVFQAPEGDHTVEDSMRFDRCCHMDLARMSFDYEDGIGPKNSYIRVVGDPCDTSPPPYLGFTHVGGKYKGIDVSGSPWKLPEYNGSGKEIPYPYYIRLINTIMPVSGIGA